MRRQPISPHQRPRIVAHVAERNHWEDTIKGFAVSLCRVADKTLPVAWAVTFKNRTLSGQAPTVTAAIDSLNAVVSAGQPAFLRRVESPVIPESQTCLFASNA